MAKTLIRKPWGGQQLEAFDLTEMCSFTKGEEIEELGDIVTPGR